MELLDFIFEYVALSMESNKNEEWFARSAGDMSIFRAGEWAEWDYVQPWPRARGMSAGAGRVDGPGGAWP
ncbi:hypothetical protein RCH07_003073 [Arthrobacter sp. CG_A4]|nr:hypothetical protein [Arthrobacter sp. CG_A4]